MRIIDVNASAGFWPIQRFTDRTLADLNHALAGQEMNEVWLSAIESILFPEPDTFDRALFEQLSAFSRFHPVKTVNPVLANWRDSLLETAGRFPLAAVKLFPSYHGYSLESPVLNEVGQAARKLNLPILIQMRVNDERNQPPFLQVPGVSAQEIARFSLRHADNTLIALCAYNREVAELAKGSSNLLVDLSFLDGCDSIRQFDEILPVDRFVFGSHAPFLHIPAAKMKLTHFEISEPVRRAVASENLLSRLNGKVPCHN